MYVYMSMYVCIYSDIFLFCLLSVEIKEMKWDVYFVDQRQQFTCTSFHLGFSISIQASLIHDEQRILQHVLVFSHSNFHMPISYINLSIQLVNYKHNISWQTLLYYSTFILIYDWPSIQNRNSLKLQVYTSPLVSRQYAYLSCV